MADYCKNCGLPLAKKWRKWNKRFRGPEGKHRTTCNDACRKSWEWKRRTKNQPKYGPLGTSYMKG